MQQQVDERVETCHDFLHEVPTREIVDAGLYHLGPCIMDDVENGPCLLLELVESEDDGVELGQRPVPLVVGNLKHLIISDDEYVLALQLTLLIHAFGMECQVVCLPLVEQLFLTLKHPVGRLVFYLSSGIDGPPRGRPVCVAPEVQSHNGRHCLAGTCGWRLPHEQALQALDNLSKPIFELSLGS